MVAPLCIPSTWESEVGGRRVPGDPGLHRDFEANVDSEILSQTKAKTNKQKKQQPQSNKETLHSCVLICSRNW